MLIHVGQSTGTLACIVICINKLLNHYFIFIDPIVDIEVKSATIAAIYQPLILECNVTFVRGITSTVDVIWTTGDTQVRRVNYVTDSNTNSSSVYDSFVIPSLNISQIGIIYQCEIWINSIILVSKANYAIPIPGM